MEKRKSFKFPEVDMHSKIIVANGLPDFLLYEHYGILYLTTELKGGEKVATKK